MQSISQSQPGEQSSPQNVTRAGTQIVAVFVGINT
jgi:hypothetical protein